MSTQRLVEVRLYGHLRARFSRVYRLAVKTPGEAVRALCCVVPGFKRYLAEHSAPGYRIVVDKTPVADDKELFYPSGIAAIKIVPAVAGAAGGGKILAGLALLGLSFVTGGGAFIGFAAAFEAGSVSAFVSAASFSIGTSLVLPGAAVRLT